MPERVRISIDNQRRPVSRWLQILLTPIIIVLSILGTVIFSAFFAVILIPVAIAIFFIWKRAQKRYAPVDDAIDAEFTVVPPTADSRSKSK